MCVRARVHVYACIYVCAQASTLQAIHMNITHNIFDLKKGNRDRVVS